VLGAEDEGESGDVERPEEALAPEVPGVGSDSAPEADPGSSSEAAPEFDVTTGEDLVEALPDESEIPPEVRTTFWSTVLLLKVALLATTLAALLAYFRSQYLLGAGLATVGLVAGGRAVLTVRSYRRPDPAAEGDD